MTPSSLTTCSTARERVVSSAPTASTAAGADSFARPKSSTFARPCASTMNVGGLQIPVHDAGAVRRGECVGHLRRDAQRFGEPHALARDQLIQRLAIHSSMTM